MTDDLAVDAAVYQFKRFLVTGAERHVQAVSTLINSAEDPWRVGCKVARQMGRARALVLLDRKLVEAGCRGRFNP